VDRQTDIQTYRHADRNTSQPGSGVTTLLNVGGDPRVGKGDGGLESLRPKPH